MIKLSKFKYIPIYITEYYFLKQFLKLILNIKNDLLYNLYDS